MQSVMEVQDVSWMGMGGKAAAAGVFLLSGPSCGKCFIFFCLCFLGDNLC